VADNQGDKSKDGSSVTEMTLDQWKKLKSAKY